MACVQCGSETPAANGVCPDCGTPNAEQGMVAVATNAADTKPVEEAKPSVSTKRASAPKDDHPLETDPSATNPSSGRFCGRCGSAVSNDDEYCGICGNPLTEAALERMRRRQAGPPSSRPLPTLPSTYTLTRAATVPSSPSPAVSFVRILAILCILGAVIAAAIALFIIMRPF